MKDSSFRIGHRHALALLSALALSAVSVSAANRYWDGPNTGGVGNGSSDGGNGVWNSAVTNWDSGNGLPRVVWTNAGNDNAVFAGTPGTVTNDANIIVGGLQFDTNGYTLVDGTLTFGIDGAIAVNADASMSTVLGGASSNVTKTGSGTFTMSGSSVLFSGDLIVSNGILKDGAHNRRSFGRINSDNTGRVIVDGASSELHLDFINSLGWNHSNPVDRPLVVRNGGTIVVSGGTRAGNVTLQGGTLTINGIHWAWGKIFLGTISGGQDATVAVNGPYGASTIDGVGHLALGTNTQFDVTDVAAGTDLTVSATLMRGANIPETSDGAGFTKKGNGTMELTSPNLYDGATTVEGGTLRLSAAGGTIDTSPNWTIEAGAVLDVRHDVLRDAGTALGFGLSGTDAGRVDVTGTVTLGGTLSVSGPSLPGFSYIIIDNDGVDAVVGTFADLLEGAPVTVGGNTFAISYVGGDGNDVALLGSLTLQKSVSAATVNLDPGVTNLTYTLDVLNTYTASLPGITVTDALPAEVSFVTSSIPAILTNGYAVFDLGTLDPGSNVLITIDVLVTSTVPTTITNRASATSTDTDVVKQPAQGLAETMLYRPADLAITKTLSSVLSNLYYTIRVTNGGLGVAENVSVTDTLPADTTFDSSLPLPDTISGRDHTFNLGDLPAGGATSITLTLVYTGAVPSLVTNTASVTIDGFEDILTNNIFTLVSPVGEGLDLVLTKTVNPTNLPIGSSNLTYTLTVNNIGTTQAVSVVVTDSLPAGVAFVVAVPPPILANGNDYTFDLGTITAGSGTSIVIDAVYTLGLTGVTLTNWAAVYTPTQELSLVNNDASAETVILDPLVDTDGDGMTDADELIAGTLPLDPTSYLWVRIARMTDLNVRQLAFPSVATRTYHIQSSTNFVTGPWVDVQTNIMGIDALINTFRTSLLDRVYYRIGVESP